MDGGSGRWRWWRRCRTKATLWFFSSTPSPPCTGCPPVASPPTRAASPISSPRPPAPRSGGGGAGRGGCSGRNS
eukprot:673360-Prorocentrum_minimum.AAC.1